MDEHDRIPEQRRAPKDQAVPDPAHRVDVLAELYRWTTPALIGGPDVPVFGSPRWCALDDDDPAKTFAAVRAALAWWFLQVRVAEKLATDHVESSHRVAAAEDWSKVAQAPTHAELKRRRGQG